MNIASKQIAERAFKAAIKACIGADNSWRLQRISFPLLHWPEYKLSRKPFDVLFFCERSNRWQNIKLVVTIGALKLFDTRILYTTAPARAACGDAAQSPSGSLADIDA
jgi:hypothetical protein